MLHQSQFVKYNNYHQTFKKSMKFPNLMLYTEEFHIYWQAKVHQLFLSIFHYKS